MFDANTASPAGQPGADLLGINDAAGPDVGGGTCIDRGTDCGVDARAHHTQTRPHGHADTGYHYGNGIDTGIDFDTGTSKTSPIQPRQQGQGRRQHSSPRQSTTPTP